MTDTAPRTRTRLSKGRVRTVAWVAGGVTFLTGLGIFGAAPKVASSFEASPHRPRQRPVVIVKKVLRRVIITDAPAAPITISQGSSSSSSSGGGSTSPPPVTTSTGGS